MPNPKAQRYTKFKQNPELEMFRALENAQKTAQQVAENEVREIRKEFEERLRVLENNPVQEAFKSIKSLKGEKGEKGESIRGEKGEKGDKPVVGIDFPQPKDGKDADEEEIYQRLLTQIPEPKNGIDGTDGKDGKDGSPDKPQEIATKLNTLTEQVEQKVIKGLDGELKALKANLSQKETRGHGGGMGDWKHESFSGDGATTSFTLASRVAANGKACIVRYQGQVQDDTTHYSISGRTLSTTFTPANGTTISIAYVRT